jgi:3',5'-cyclic AMP phosphodiesterase CpdA
MDIALIADPHVSLTAGNSRGRLLERTRDIAARTIADLNRRRPDLVVWLGDLTHEGTPEVRAVFAQLLRQLEPPALQIAGNHDVEAVTKTHFGHRVPIVRRHWMTALGWQVLLIDTVQEYRPDDPTGRVEAIDVQLVKAAAAEASRRRGALLVLGHHPPRQGHLDAEAFFRGVGAPPATAVYVAGHTHQHRYEQIHGWHVIESAGMAMYPLEYRWLTLGPDRLRVNCVAPDLGPLREEAAQWLRDIDRADTLYEAHGSPEARDIVIPVARR